MNEMKIDVNTLLGPFVSLPLLDPENEREWVAEGPVYFGKNKDGIIDYVGNGLNKMVRLKWTKGHLIMGPFKTYALDLTSTKKLTVEIDLACNYYIRPGPYKRGYIALGHRGAVAVEMHGNRIISLVSRRDSPVRVQFGRSPDVVVETAGVIVEILVTVPDGGMFCHVWVTARP
jgi:hypothetical protein